MIHPLIYYELSDGVGEIEEAERILLTLSLIYWKLPDWSGQVVADRVHAQAIVVGVVIEEHHAAGLFVVWPGA